MRENLQERALSRSDTSTTSALKAGSPPNLPHGESTATKRRTTEVRYTKPLRASGEHSKDLQESGGVPSVLDNLPAFPGNVNPFRLAGVAKNADSGEVEPLCVDMHERGRAPRVAGTVPALAKAIAGVEPGSKAEIASTTKPEGLVP